MRIVLTGPPGAGKGTQARVLASLLAVPALSSGNLFRAEIRQGTELGRLVRRHTDAGEPVPDELTTTVVTRRLGPGGGDEMSGPYATPPPDETSGGPDLGELRRSHLAFAVPAAVLVVGGYLLYILLSGFAPGVVDLALAGHLTLGLALGPGMFVTLLLTAWRYARHMRSRVDPHPHADGVRTHQANPRRDERGAE